MPPSFFSVRSLARSAVAVPGGAPRLSPVRLSPVCLSSARLFSSTPTFASSSSASAASEPEPLIFVTDLPAPGSGHIRILELNRPAARNAISRGLLAALRAQVDAVAQQYDSNGREVEGAATSSSTSASLGPTRALIVASALDSCFCAGADLKERRGFSAAETAAFLGDLRGTLTALSALPVPTIAAVSSLAVGGGLELALATHMRVLSSNAVVGLPETRLGIIPGAGGTYRLPMLIGVSRARDLILTGRRVSAPEAYFLGIADRLVEVVDEASAGADAGAGAGAAQQTPEEKQKDQADLLNTARRAALSEAVRLAEEICEGGPVAVRAALQAVQYPTEAVENKMYERVVATQDRDEALRAFAEKRRPVFKGR